MASASTLGFRWLNILEKEFDTNFVDLVLYLGMLESEDAAIFENAKQKMKALSSCFAQLVHKAQTIFQNSAKIEAELISLRVEVMDIRAEKQHMEEELRRTIKELQTAQLVSMLPNTVQNAKTAMKAKDARVGGVLGAYCLDPNEVNRITKRLQQEFEKKSDGKSNATDDTALLRAEVTQLRGENHALRNNILTLHSEVYGARLAAKYLDKELAGRIQQLQLFGKEMRGDIRDKLWRQLEAEILLQRHKTIVRACRRNNQVTQKQTVTACAETEVVADARMVTVKRSHDQGLGISITGGREHGVPILISELEPHGPAAITGQLFIGDAILSVNGIDLRQACHRDAVKVLQKQTGDCVLQVQYVAADDSDTNSLSEDGYNFHYKFFDPDVCDDAKHVQSDAVSVTPTAPRTPIDSGNDNENGNDDESGSVADPSYPPQLSDFSQTDNPYATETTDTCLTTDQIDTTIDDVLDANLNNLSATKNTSRSALASDLNVVLSSSDDQNMESDTLAHDVAHNFDLIKYYNDAMNGNFDETKSIQFDEMRFDDEPKQPAFVVKNIRTELYQPKLATSNELLERDFYDSASLIELDGDKRAEKVAKKVIGGDLSSYSSASMTNSPKTPYDESCEDSSPPSLGPRKFVRKAKSTARRLATAHDTPYDASVTTLSGIKTIQTIFHGTNDLSTSDLSSTNSDDVDEKYNKIVEKKLDKLSALVPHDSPIFFNRKSNDLIDDLLKTDDLFDGDSTDLNRFLIKTFSDSSGEVALPNLRVSSPKIDSNESNQSSSSFNLDRLIGNRRASPEMLVQYERRNATNQTAEFDHDITSVYINEKRLNENKEKLLERYSKQYKFNKNVDGNGDPDFGTPV